MPLAPDPPFPKSQGNSIRSKDWNDAINEVIRLDDAKLNRSGDNITGALTVGGNLGVGTTTPGAKLEVKGAAILDAGGNAKLYTGTGTAELNRSLELLNSLGNATSSGLKAGGVLVADNYTFATPGKNDLVVKGRLAVATPAAGATLHVNGGGAIGPFAPSNVQGSLNVCGSSAELGFVRRNLTAWPSSPAAGDRFVWYNPDGVARLWTQVNGDLMVVKSNGSVGLGVIDPQLRLEISGRARLYPDPASSAGLWLVGQSTSSVSVGDVAFMGMRDNTTVGFWGNAGAPNWRMWVDTISGALSITGQAFKAGGGAWAALSDARLKHSITPLAGALDRLLALRGVAFEWNEPGKYGTCGGPQIGFVAQEVETVFPQWIDETADGYKAIAISGFEALAVEALRELRAENRQLAAACQQLQTALSHLSSASAAGGAR